MTGTVKALLIVLTGTLLLGTLVWFLPGWIGLAGSSVWILRCGLWLLLGVAAFLLFRILRADLGRTTGDDPITTGFRAARKRLAELLRGRRKDASPEKLPVAILMGPAHSTKTTLFTHAGLDPELLAGETVRGDAIAPTEALNVWFAAGTVWVEAGGGVLQDPTAWNRLGELLEPTRLAAVFGRRGTAPRQVVLCFSVESFLLPGATEAVPAAARELRGRLSELAGRLGVRLPVYVLFTRSDRIPHFTDFVRALGREEAVREVLGATLPLAPAEDAGTHAEREGRRIVAAFDRILRSLSLRRLDLLPRDPAGAGSAYEFPRELRKLAGPVTTFLVELTRPGQRAAGPYLRGFYFTGVRPIVMEDLPAPSAPLSAGGGGSSAMGATRVFSVQELQGMTPAAPTPPRGSRRVPQWVFHERVFREVIPADLRAREGTAGGARVNLLRRLALTGGVAVLALLLVAIGGSFFGNRALQKEARAAMEGVLALDSAAPELPDPDALQRLERLRSLTAELRGHRTEGPPLRLRWGLNRSEPLLEEARRVYFGALGRVATRDLHGILASELAALPDAPDAASAYGRSYDALKAYLILSEHGDRSTPDFLSPVLMDRWIAGRGIDPGSEELARRQIDFYASELAIEDPYAFDSDGLLIARGRRYLNQFTGSERFYQALVSDASARAPSVRYAAEFPGSETVLQAPHEVPGAFTSEGWGAVEASLADIDRLLAQESWVVGEQALAREDRARLAEEISGRYRAQFLTEWETLLASAALPRFSSPQDAAGKLARLGGNQSPILQLLSLTARHTDVDSVRISPAFQPVHLVTPPEITDRFVSDANQGWVAALGALGAALDRAAATPGDPAPLTQAQAAAADARSAVQQMARDFSIAGEAQSVARAVERLLEAPIVAAEGLLRTAPIADLNGQGSSFCADVTPILRKYPFTAGASEEATPDELATLFLPGGSIVWSFHAEVLSDLVIRQGSRYAARPGGGTSLNPAFLEFLNQSALVTRAFFGDEGGTQSEPLLQFQLRAHTTDDLPEVTIAVDRQSRTFTRTSQSSQIYRWEGARANEVRILGQVDGNEVPLLRIPSGPWALFRFLQSARWEERGGGSWVLEWTTEQGMTLTADLNLGTAPAVMRPGFFQGFACVARIAR